MSKKVKQLDFVRNRVQSTIQRVKDIIDLDKCLEGVSSAMNSEDFESAAKYVRRYQTIDSAVLTKADFENLQAAENKLKQVIQAKTKEALNSRNQAQMLRYCSILFTIGMKEDATNFYVAFLDSILSQASSQYLKELANEEMSCIDVLSSLFQTVADMIADQQPLMEQNFGSNISVEIVTSLKKPIDVYSVKFIQLFCEKTKLSQISSSLSKALKERKNLENLKRAYDTTLKTSSLVELLDDIVLLSKISEIFLNFLRGQQFSTKTLSPNLSAPNKSVGNRRNVENVNSTLEEKLQETMGHYVALEKFQLLYSVFKAVSMDEPTEDGLSSKMVDFVFFSLQAGMQRVISSLNVEAVCAVANVFQMCLDEFFKILQQQLSDTSSRSKNNHLTVLNNISVTCDFVNKLNRDYYASCKHVFKAPKQLEKLEQSCKELNETSKHFKNVLRTKLAEVAGTLDPRTREVVELLKAENFILTENIFAEKQIGEDVVVSKMKNMVISMLEPFRKNLNDTNYEILAKLILQNIISKLEKAVLQIKFNQLGALHFAKLLRVIMSFFSSLTESSVRADFVKISQISSLLNFEKVEDIYDYSGSNEISLRLTTAEIRKILSNRTEFSSEKISKLKI